MTKRSSQQQTKHDKKGRQIARKLKNQRWDVQADGPEYDKPDSIGKCKRIPDIRATKAGAECLLEIETPATNESNENNTRHSVGVRRKSRGLRSE